MKTCNSELQFYNKIYLGLFFLLPQDHFIFHMTNLEDNRRGHVFRKKYSLFVSVFDTLKIMTFVAVQMH